jgi:transcriptional regulator with XRE-family HTH domain
MANPQHGPEVPSLARRLRELRESGFVRLTQSDLGKALGGQRNPLSTATISMWESPSGDRIPPESRLEAYARLFCTARSFEGEPHMLSISQLTAEERERYEELRQELTDLRQDALANEDTASREDDPSPVEPESMWHFPDRSRITLVCSRLAPERQPPSANPRNLDYVRYASLADLDTLIDIYGAIRAYNPTSRVFILDPDELTQRDVANHLVLIGGRTLGGVTRWFSRLFPIPIEPGDPGDLEAIAVRDVDGEEREFRYTLADGELVEDVGVFVRGENPAAPKRTLTICSGITTRGVHGAARCFIDRELRERNEQYLNPRFPEGSTYCIVMRVPVVNGYPITPDLSKPENRLFEWSDRD